MTTAALWLTNTFSNFDYSVLKFFHELAISYSKILTPLSEVLQIIGDFPVLPIFWIGALCFIFMKDKKLGMYICGSMAFGVIITNFTIKWLVARPRPYDLELVNDYRVWFEYVGSHFQEDLLSFPSGHATAAMSGITGFFFWSKNKKVSWLAYIYTILIAASRNYLMVHYPSDVLFGILVGFIASILAHFTIKLIYWWCNKYTNNFISKFVLTGKFK